MNILHVTRKHLPHDLIGLSMGQKCLLQKNCMQSFFQNGINIVAQIHHSEEIPLSMTGTITNNFSGIFDCCDELFQVTPR
mmetsp:Transcript_22718/g.53662  ORF Transcript_22718/g.53662 Transcript_22718/m.53662 type:complete len:80 (+) Transcript_22718:137-376(+)